MIPNIVKGKGVTGAINYALGEGYDGEKKSGKEHALDRAAGIDPKGAAVELAEGEASRASIIGGQNFGFEIDSRERLELARKAMEWNALPQNQTSKTRKCENDCLHASLSWEKGQSPSADDMRDAAQGFLKSLGMDTAQAVFIAHDDKEHSHVHIIASRVDPETGRAFSQVNDFAYAQAWALHYERERGLKSQSEARQTLHKILDAVEARNGAAVAELLTERSPTFTARELDKALMLAKLTPDDRTKFRSEILNGGEVVGLRETADSEVTRYTTRKVLADEIAVLRGADRLADDGGHGVSRRSVTEAAAKYTLIPEQAEALAQLTEKKGFGILWGEAGTGKSHMLKAVCSVYEKEGFNVIGLSHTNKVVQQMRGDGFARAETIMGELSALDKGAATWNKKSVVVVDEAAMVSTELLGRVVAAAEKSGAKLILSGDDAQLGSIERGGMFETLRLQHGAAILEQVQRVKTAEEKAAFNQMHGGKFRGALETFSKSGGIVWSEKQDDALRGMAEAYTTDTAAEPSKRRFMTASTNAEVDALNDYARAMHKKRGDLGEDHTIKTAHGDLVLAVGDRIQFTGNGGTKTQKNAGLVTAGFATVKAVEVKEGKPARLTIAFDVGKDEKPREMKLTVGGVGRAGEFDRFKLGYAGTIYKAQGATLDQAYICHSASMRNATAYVGLTRHRGSVKMFVSRETIRTMDRARKIFPRNQADAAEDIVRALDIMAAGMGRQQNKRSAAAYFIDQAVALGIDLRRVAKVATAAKPVQAYAAVSQFIEIERQNAQRKAILQNLTRLAGREITQDEGRGILRDRGGGQSL
jgi:ATP-dependent exoDNAse (exonuclease V) alpha subunit